MWGLVIVTIINFLLLFCAIYAENNRKFINTSYSSILRGITFFVPKRFKYFGITTFFLVILLEADIILWLFCLLTKQYEIAGFCKSVGRIIPALVLFASAVDYLIYWLFNSRKYKKIIEPKLKNDATIVSIGGNAIEEIRCIIIDNSKEVVFILPWLHDVSYGGYLKVRNIGFEDVKYNFMFYNQLVNDITAESKSVVEIKYAKDSRLHSAETFLSELSDVINTYFSDFQVSIVSHGPQAGVEALLLTQQQSIKSLKLLCGGIGVTEYYVECMKQIINDGMSIMLWEKRHYRKMASEIIQGDRSCAGCINCEKRKIATTVDTACHGFCDKNCTCYFDSLTEYTTEYIMKMISSCDCEISIVWPEYAYGPWRKHIARWAAIPNVTFFEVKNCYETFRERQLKDTTEYFEIYAIK